MKISDLAGLGKAIEKLIDVISQGTGTVTKANFIRKTAEAKAYETEIMAKAKANEMKILADAIKEITASKAELEYKDGIVQVTSTKQNLPISNDHIEEMNLLQRSQKRTGFQEAQHQMNIESVTCAAAEQFTANEAISNEPVDPDWIKRFFKYAQEVSNEEMQLLWGRILAGEIKKPQSYSIRTLELIKNITFEEAQVITKASMYAFQIDDEFCLLRHDKILRDYGITFFDIVLLKELGVLVSADSMTFEMPLSKEGSPICLIYGKLAMLIHSNASAIEKPLPVYGFTKVGKDLLKLTNPKQEVRYFEDIADFFYINKRKVDYTTFQELQDHKIMLDLNSIRHFEFHRERWP